MTSGPEWERVEKPLLGHLALLGWERLIWTERQPDGIDARASERDVLLERRLESALRRINLGADGLPWLDDGRVRAAVAELRSMPPGGKLLENNRQSTGLLLGGVNVPGLDGWDGGRDRTIDYVDWDDWSANEFLAVSQFSVATPGQAPNIRPDVTLFVNGIPLVVIEAKPPGTESGIADAIDQLRRYANQRGSGIAEGAEHLFWTNQFTVATTGERAEAGTFSALPEHYMAWKDPFPSTVAEVAASLGKDAAAVTQQEVLTAGMLAPERLLDIIRHFTLFAGTASGRVVKLVCRYQQYRAVHKAIERLLAGKTRAKDGEVDRRGGIVWHTQGSGKSLTMVFLARAMRSHPALRSFKIVLVTDRIDLEQQLADTAKLTGETVKMARNGPQARALLSQPGPAVVMVMIQKYNDTGSDAEGLSEGESFGVLNDSESILVLVDEAHRSHASVLHANLMAALPNAARIGFTGTPIIMGKRKETTSIFGGYLDQYTLAQSEADGSTVPIHYEGRTTDAAVSGASKMDDLFFQWFSELSNEDRDTLQRQYATAAQVLEAPRLIEAKARDMVRHYVGTAMPDGFKGMVIAVSRRACTLYVDALNRARDQLLDELLEYAAAGGKGPGRLDADELFLAGASQHVDLIRELRFVPVISGDNNDPADWAAWTDKGRQRAVIDRFQRPLGTGEGQDPLALLVVQSMLLTGFDAPQAQVLYLDRLIQEAELLQAVARVNRTAPKKSYGLVVDYYGVSAQLTEALAAYRGSDGEMDPDAGAALRPLSAEIEKLEPQRQRVRQLFAQRSVSPSADTVEDCVALLADERLRAEFDAALRKLLTTFDTVLPRPEALPFVADVNLFGEIQVQTRRRYRDTPDGDFDPHKYKEKVRQLIDRHVTVLDLSQKVPPVRITDADFSSHVGRLASDRAKASEMEHALRHHIREHLDENPAHYTKLSERIDAILERLEGQWDQIALEFEHLAETVNAGPADENNTGLDPVTELPFYGLMVEQVASSDADVGDRLVELTTALVAEIRRIASKAGFWSNAIRQDDLRKAVKGLLDYSDLFTYESLDELAVVIVAVAKANQHKLT